MQNGIIRVIILSAVCAASFVGCNKGAKNEGAEAPPKAVVEDAGDPQQFRVDDASQFALVAASEHASTTSLNVTGTVTADISRTIPVISLANGRVVAVHARLGDYVRRGQLLLEVQSTDVSGAFDQYLKASNDERLANTQFERAKVLYERGALPKSQLEIAENSELDAKTDLVAAEQQLHVLGVDKTNPSAAVKIFSPATGVIISQNVTDAGAAGVTLSGSSTAFTIADLSHVWVICDVYENDLATLRLGQTAKIRLNAYPDRLIKGSISDIGAVLDPSIRTAKVRIQVENPDMLMRIGMFASVVLYGQHSVMHTSLPATAILHLQDRDWVFTPAGQNEFRRIQVQIGMMLPNGQQEILSGVQPGQQVVATALSVQNSVAQR
jgi:cobalt-zinc-cadmium efflux system membrane fusion protein